MRGFFPSPGHLHWIADRRVTVSLRSLPPADEAADLPGRVLVGVSAGCLAVLLAASVRPVKRLVLVEPFLRPRKVWALMEWLSGYVGRHPEAADLVRPYLAREYDGLAAAIRAPIDVLVGDVPLEPPRPLVGLPSLTSEEDRRFWTEHPTASLTVCRSGHNVPDEARDALLQALEGLPP